MTPSDVHLLFERFGFPVYRRCLRILRDQALAEDVSQDVFVRVLRYGASYHGGSQLAWLLRIAERAALDRLRRHGASARCRIERPETAGPVAGLEPSERSLLLAELLARLPARLQEVAVLSALDGMNHEEMASALSCSTITVKRRLRALRRRAQALAGTTMAEEGGHAQPPS